MEIVKIQSGKNVLSGELMHAENQLGGILFIAGGGLQRINYREWQKYLASIGYSSLTFDFPGVEDSPGELSQTSLSTRTENAIDAFNVLKDSTGLDKQEIFILGRSMGGPIALRVATQVGTRKLVLFVPAAYDDAAYAVPFGEEFSKIIRTENSWKGSSDFKLAEDFEGRLMVIYGEEEHIIPEQIQKLYLDIAKSKGTALIMQGIGHNKNLWDDNQQSSQNRLRLYSAVQKFIEK